MYKFMDEVVVNKIDHTKYRVQKWLVAETLDGKPAIVLERFTGYPTNWNNDNFYIVNYTKTDDDGSADVKEIYPVDFDEALLQARSDMLNCMREARKPKKVV